MVVETTVDAGVCGFRTRIRATCDDGQSVRFEISTPCENIERLAGTLREVDAYDEIGAGFDGEIHQAAVRSLKGCCSGCVVPIALFKSMQVAASLALPSPASIAFGAESK